MKKAVNLFFISLLILYTSANSVTAIDLPAAMKQTMAQETAGMPSLLNLVISMIIVIAMIYVTGWIYNKLNIVNRDKLNKLGAKDLDAHRFTVLQSMPLGQQRHLYSVRMNGKVLLIGSTPTHINLLKEFDMKENITDDEPVTDENEYSPAEQQIRKAVGNAIDIDELYKKYKN